jgi:hypothetical protein
MQCDSKVACKMKENLNVFAVVASSGEQLMSRIVSNRQEDQELETGGVEPDFSILGFRGGEFEDVVINFTFRSLVALSNLLEKMFELQLFFTGSRAEREFHIVC